jgi:hypothetical protein
MTVMVETAAAAPAPARTQPAKKKATVKKAAKPAKVQGVHALPSGRFEVTMFLGAFDTIEEAIACREKGVAFRESLKAAPAKKKRKAD